MITADDDTRGRRWRTSITRGANPASKVIKFLSDLKSNDWRLTESLLHGARRKRVETGSEEKVDLMGEFCSTRSYQTKTHGLVG